MKAQLYPQLGTTPGPGQGRGQTKGAFRTSSWDLPLPYGSGSKAGTEAGPVAGLGAEGGAATGPGWGWGKGKGKRREVGPIVILGQLPHPPLLSSSLMTPHQQAMDLVPASP